MKLGATGLLLILAMAFSLGTATAQEASQSKAKLKDVKEKKDVGDIDEEITNPRLRQSIGSKSRYSMSVGVSYLGSSVETPLEQTRPNLYGDEGVQLENSLGGSVSARYRWTPKDSVFVGAGWSMFSPFLGDPEPNFSDPSVTYNRAFKAIGLQNSLSVGFDVGTSIPSQDINQIGSLFVTHTVLKTFQTFPITIGVSASVAGYGFSGDVADQAINDNRTSFLAALYPFSEIMINDRFSFRTVYGFFNFRNLDGSDGDITEWDRRPHYMSFGLNTSITRDILLYPSVQINPENLTPGRTNVGLSASLNIF